MKTRVFIVAAALALGAPTAAHAAIIPVQELKGAFAASNSTVTKTPDGVHFGTYADATALGGTLTYNGINGTPVSALAEFGYTFTYRQAGNTTGAAPYARVFIDADPAVDSDLDGVSNNDIDHDIILDPSMVGATPAPGGTCPAVAPAQATDLTFTMSTSLVRFDDDQGADCVNSVMTFEDAKAAAGPNAVVSSLNVTQGFSTGQDVSALLRDMTVNANTFAFDVPPAPGVASTTTSTTTIVQVPAPVGGLPTGSAVAGVQATQTCRGATVRRIHAPNRRGERFLRVNAALQTPAGLRALRSQGRTITVDLRNRAEANYNVRLIARYRTKSGKVRRVVTRRNLSVACS
jgi:hypothetical protein